MNTAETLKSNAQDYIHDLAYDQAEAIKKGNAADEAMYARAVRITIQGYLEADLMTREEATLPIGEAFQEVLVGEKPSEEKTLSQAVELKMDMRRKALADLHGIYEEAAKAKVNRQDLTEVDRLAKAVITAQAYIKLGLITEEDRHNQYLSAYKVDYGIDVG